MRPVERTIMSSWPKSRQPMENTVSSFSAFHRLLSSISRRRRKASDLIASQRSGARPRGGIRRLHGRQLAPLPARAWHGGGTHSSLERHQAICGPRATALDCWRSTRLRIDEHISLCDAHCIVKRIAR
jgi:hypothetical protein